MPPKPPLKHRWSLRHNYLAGITAGDWVRLLRTNRIDAAYAHRGAFVSLLSLVNAWHRRRESDRFDAAIRSTPLAAPPLFILGHWRSGTTHLHNLLALDSEQFAFANTYQVVNPQTFLTTEAVNTRRFAWMVPPRRPMDNMALSFQSPQEDEFAPCLMSLRSPYLGISFPRREDYYHRHLTFRDADPGDATAWLDAFEWFLKKLTLHTRRPLLLKSPTHTARVRMLAERFPGARFVHIHREPAAVFQSCRHFYDTAMWHTYLQRPDPEAIEPRILRRYRDLHDALFSDLPTLPSNRFHEVSFDQLERDPVATVASIYEALHLDGFERLRPRITAYAEGLRGYERNRFDTLSATTRARIRTAWEPIYSRWGYTLEA